jgi:hypothetical protein
LVGSGIARGAELVDGCPSAAAGETTPVSWRLEQTNKHAQELQGVLKEWGAARVGEEKQAGVGFTMRHPWRTAAARCSREGGPAGFIAVRKAVREVFLRTKGTKLGHGPWHGRSTARRGGDDVWRVCRRAVGWAARRGYSGTAAHGCEARGAKGEGRNGGSTAHGPAGRRLPRRSDPRGGRGECARCGATRRDVMQYGALA